MFLRRTFLLDMYLAARILVLVTTPNQLGWKTGWDTCLSGKHILELNRLTATV